MVAAGTVRGVPVDARVVHDRLGPPATVRTLFQCQVVAVDGLGGDRAILVGSGLLEAGHLGDRRGDRDGAVVGVLTVVVEVDVGLREGLGAELAGLGAGGLACGGGGGVDVLRHDRNVCGPAGVWTAQRPEVRLP